MPLHPRLQRYFLGLTLLLLSCGPARSQSSFFFHDHDKPVVFLGDSITAQRMYTTLIECYVLTRFPQWDVTFRNLGWSGDTVTLSQRGGFDNGLQRDILSLNPACITINFGMNDAHAGAEGYDDFVKKCTRLVRELKVKVPRIAVLTPSPREEFQAGEPGGTKYNRVLAQYSVGLRQVAHEQGVAFVDELTPFLGVIDEGRKSGLLSASGNPRLNPDGVHPNWAGQLVMATAILKGLQAPAMVSRLELDAAAQRVLLQTDCQAEVLQRQAGSAILTFRRTDKVLPWFVPAEADFILRVPGFTPFQDLSRYELKVDNLPAGEYDLLVDDKRAATLSGDDLAQGLNISQVAGAITSQAELLFKLVVEKNNLFYTRWRQVQLFEVPSWLLSPDVEKRRRSELDRLDGRIAQMERQINQLRRPVPHVFKLVAAKTAPAIPAPALPPPEG